MQRAPQNGGPQGPETARSATVLRKSVGSYGDNISTTNDMLEWVYSPPNQITDGPATPDVYPCDGVDTTILLGLFTIKFRVLGIKIDTTKHGR